MADIDLSTGTPDAQIDHSASIEYWSGINADVDGMLGGFPHVSRVDLQGSRALMAKLGVLAGKNEGDAKPLRRAVDCGAGIGRITRGLLLSLADKVDVVEPIKKFTDALADVPGVGEVYNVGLELWKPASGAVYDLVWNQWCVGHLTDLQLVGYLRRCGEALRREEGGKVVGWIVVKENLTSEEDVYDETDSSVTRTEEKFKELFKEAGLQIVRTELQRGFPRELYPVRTWALQPMI
ncbi:hypothetical protein VE01_02476 [Pseudogymnoascus verrucosus]|uniref:Alpha N-terminal protein methyltransferase 1 n=1 Tax=Pseudogymnoascus verrucosus TaxID=342668 RepID=A0A1B8GTA2_9PEZI|nr:uncharacterized protein VE01_02476 [Pseudogymnoascus verrucosus]OBT99051.1 hypothetical protein VE01_02476 [Pseudogymnoascus verrucosus]